MSKKRFDPPYMGYGTWNRDEAAAYNGVLTALEVGYRHIDTAQAYANEAAVGRAMSDTAVPRGDMFITTKVDPVNYGPNQLRPSVETSLNKLGVEQVDLLLLHFPSLYDEYPVQDYVQQLAEVYDQGLCRFIGVSNFTRHYIDEAQSILGERAISTNQVEIHAYMQNAPIVNYCQHLGIPLTAYSPLARGALLTDPVIQGIADKHDASTSQIALAFLLGCGFIVIPSSASKERISENFAAQSIRLSDTEMLELRNLDRGMRLVDEDWCPKWDR